MQEYPLWASIAIATKYGEPQEFTCMFPSWPYADLRLATIATEMNLPADFSASTPFPSAGRVRVSGRESAGEWAGECGRVGGRVWVSGRESAGEWAGECG